MSGEKDQHLATKQTDDPRIIQATRFWELGFGSAFGFGKLEHYLTTIPEIPAELVGEDERFPVLLLVEPRLGLNRSCQLVGIDCGYKDHEIVPAVKCHPEFTVPTWIRVRYGYWGWSAYDCRKAIKGKGAAAITALQGACLYAHRRDLWSGHEAVFAGSAVRSGREETVELLRLSMLGHSVSLHPRHYKSGDGDYALPTRRVL